MSNIPTGDFHGNLLRYEHWVAARMTPRIGFFASLVQGHRLMGDEGVRGVPRLPVRGGIWSDGEYWSEDCWSSVPRRGDDAIPGGVCQTLGCFGPEAFSSYDASDTQHAGGLGR